LNLSSPTDIYINGILGNNSYTVRTIGTQILQELRKASNPIAAHFWFTSIRVVDSHGKIVVVRRRFEGKNDSIAANPKIPVAQFNGLFGCQTGGFLIAIIDQNEIISQAFVFGKFNCLERTSSPVNDGR